MDQEKEEQDRKPTYDERYPNKLDIANTAAMMVVALIFFVFAFFAHYMYRQTLYNVSATHIIPWLQSLPNWFGAGLHWIYWALDQGLFIWMLCFFAFFNRAASQFMFTSVAILGVI